MASVSQFIPNFLGGVSKQPDVKKSPNQFTECLNGYPDVTLGLTKRTGIKYIETIADAPDLDDAKWFYILRDQQEAYFVAILNGSIRAWNANTGVEASITYGTGAQNYLNTTRYNYDALTVQDTTIITNKTVTVLENATSTYYLKRSATIMLRTVEYSADYTVTVGGTNYTYSTRNADEFNPSGTDTKLNADDILSSLQSQLSSAGFTVTRLKASLEISRNSDFDISARGGVSGEGLDVFQDQVGNVSNLPAQSLDGRLVKVINTDSDKDSYFAVFIAENGNQGEGYWEESIGWDEQDDGSITTTPTGLDASTMPHELINTGVNAFTFQQINWTNRLVGNSKTNTPPSFVGFKIQQPFFYSNRLGFLTESNVSMSQASEYYNFYRISALTQTDADPVDLSTSSIRPSLLHAVIPVAQGLILFSRFEQFIMFSENGVLSPSDSIIRSLSSYEMDTQIDPVDAGNYIAFPSKAPGYTRVFGMITRGTQDNPAVVDIAKVVSEWIPDDVDHLFASTQNSFIGLSSSTSNYIYFYRTFNNGNQDLFQAWYRWEVPGTVQTASVSNDKLYVITKQGGKYTLGLVNLNQVQSDVTISSGDGTVFGNPCIDLYASPSAVTYDANTDKTTLTLPYADNSLYDPVVILSSPQVSNYADAGFILPAERVDGSDAFTVDGDFTAVSDRLLVGYEYDFDVTLPRFYFRNDNGADYTATLTVARMKVSVGLSGPIGFKLNSQGSDEWYDLQGVQDADYYLANDSPLSTERVFTIPIHQRNTNFTVKIFSDSPFPISLNSMTWEGNYSPRFYRRA